MPFSLRPYILKAFRSRMWDGFATPPARRCLASRKRAGEGYA